jgi:hypothetical protein
LLRRWLAVVMARDNAQSYSGELRKPIILPSGGILGPALNHELENQYRLKIELLVRHYKIDTNLPFERVLSLLALELALAHVPGFRIATPKQRGRKKHWHLREAKALVAAIDEKRTRKGIKVAIAQAMKKNDWKWGRNIRSIETRYHEAKRQIDQRAMESIITSGLLSGLDVFAPRKATKKPTR